MPYTWTPRTTAPTSSDTWYQWDLGTARECTWYAYFRVQEGFNASYPPEWQVGQGSSGSGKYVNAKYWLDHYRDPWIPHNYGDGYVPVAGDIIVFTGTAGHCVVVESVNANSTYIVTDFNCISGYHQWGRKTDYTYGNIISGYQTTGACIGCLHFPDSTPDPPTPTPQSPITISILAEITIKRKEGDDVKIFIK